MNHLTVTSEVAAALGKTEAELADMTLGQFRELAYYKGFDVRVSMPETYNPVGGRLTIKFSTALDAPANDL